MRQGGKNRKRKMRRNQKRRSRRLEVPKSMERERDIKKTQKARLQCRPRWRPARLMEEAG